MPAIDDDLGVAAAEEPVAQSLELSPYLDKIIDFTIVADPDRAVGARHRLMARWRGVDDRQAGMREAGPTIGPDAFVVRPAMPDRRDHRPEPDLQLIAADRPRGYKETANAAQSKRPNGGGPKE